MGPVPLSSGSSEDGNEIIRIVYLVLMVEPGGFQMRNTILLPSLFVSLFDEKLAYDVLYVCLDLSVSE
jgi:hypothetical protein